MIELHGWLTFRETYRAEPNEEENIDKIISDILQNSPFKPHIQLKNGSYFTEFSLYHNHYAQDEEDVFAFLNITSKLAKGSYGIIYLFDDENAMGLDNAFQVYVLCKGKIKQCLDSFLSPFIPTVEDKETDL